VTPVDIEDRLRSAIDRLVDAVPLAHPDHPPADRTSTPRRHRWRAPFEPRRALVVAAFVVLAVLAVIVVGSRHRTGEGSASHVPSPVTGATATYPPIPPAVGHLGDCLTLPPVGMTADQTQSVIAAVTSLAGNGGRLQELGPCTGGPVNVGLAPGSEALAHQIWTRFGRDVSISVGLTSYDGSPGRSPRCGALEAPAPLPAGLHLALRLRSRTVRSGSMLTGNVVESESGPASFFMDTGQPLEAVVVRPGTRQVVGVLSGGIAGTGYGPRVGPGESGMVPVVGGTARCDGGIGSALPPGRYQVVVRVAPESPPNSPDYLTPPVALRVIPATTTR
jgi:hypothetical protein